MRYRTRLVLAVFVAVMMTGTTAVWAPSAAGSEGDPFPQTDDHRRDGKLDNQGGPDAFQYVFVDNVPPNNVPYDWIELRGDSEATWLGGLTYFTGITDGYSRQKLPIGFSFPFYGATYDCVRVATNGFLQFTTTATWLNNGCLPSTLVAGPMIAVFWDDLHLLRGGRTDTVVVGYRSFGTHMVIEFDQIGFFSNSCPNVPLKFEAVLYPNGDIKLQYHTIPIPTACANSQTIGIQQAGAVGSAALNYVCNLTGIQPTNGQAILFSRPSGIANPVTNLAGQYVDPNVVLTWNDPTQDTHGNPITIDNVQVWVGAVGSGQLLATVARGVQTYTEVNPPNNSFRLYYVRAYCSPYPGVAALCSVTVGILSYFNDFEADDGGWVADPAFGGWEWGTPTVPTTLVPHSGTKVWGTVLGANYPNDACLKLTLTPNMTVASPTATVEFWCWWSTEQSYDGVNFKVSVDNGNTWTLVQPVGNYPYTAPTANVCIPREPYWAGHGGTWTQIVLPIGQFVGQVPQFRFTFGSNGTNRYPGFYFDDMIIWGLGNQAGIPNPCTNLTGSYVSPNVVLNWTNPTTDTQGSPMVIDCVQVWLGQAGSGTLVASLLGNVQTYTHLNAPIGIRTYAVRPLNDGFFGQATSMQVTVGTPVYFNTFEVNNGNWVPTPATGGWSWGTPTNVSAPAPYSGANYWGTGLIANYTASVCWQLDLNENLVVTSADATVEFWYRFDSELTYDGCNFKASVDYGATWTVLPPSEGEYNVAAAHANNTCMGGQPMWSGHVQAAWQHATIPIGQFVGQIAMFRFEFSSDPVAGGYMGFFFDDFVIWGASQQAGIPRPCTNFSGNYVAPNAWLTWTDPTLDTHGNPVAIDSVQVWLGAAGTGTRLGSVNPGVHTFSHLLPPTGILTYTIRPANDSHFGAPTSTQVTVGTPSYFNDFETDDGNWIADPPTGGWEWGTPTVPTTLVPHSGTKVWGTVLNANYPASACFKLTLSPGLVVQSPAATVEFWCWWDTEQAFDGVNFKVSVDNGNTWTLVQPVGNYPHTASTANVCIPSEPYWAGRRSDTWTRIIIPIDQFVGQVPQFRFTFGSNPSLQYPGFFFDDMTIWGMQAASSITGVVRSFGNNLPIPDARVWVEGVTPPVTTDATGNYVLPIEAGTYSVTFDHDRFCDSTYANVVVNVGSQTVRDAILRAPHGQVSVTSLALETAPEVAIQDTFTITNPSGQCPLEFEIADTSNWLSVTPATGTVNPNQTVNVIVHIDPTGMSTGDYSSTLEVTYNSTGSPSTVRIDLYIGEAADDPNWIPTEFAYRQNYPNPFNAQTALRFDVPQQSRVRITLYNIMGQEVARLVDQAYAPGRYRVLYDASALPSGMYLVRMSAANYSKIGKMMLLK